jgi:hypothetical protein
MSSTVTTTTATIASLGAGPLLGFIAVMALLALLLLRELAAAGGPTWKPLSRNLAVAIVPLLAAFAAIVVSRLAALF